MSLMNEVVGVSARVKYFDEHQEGGRAGGIIWNGFIVWESGSHREFGDAGAGLMVDASWIDKSDEREVRKLLCWRRRFSERRLEDAVKLFEQAKSALKDNAQSSVFSGCQPPGTEQLRAVKRLRNAAVCWERKLTAILEELNPQPKPVTCSKADLEMIEKNRNEAERILNALEGVEI